MPEANQQRDQNGQTTQNLMRQHFRTLNDQEKQIIKTVKDQGQAFVKYIDEQVGRGRETTKAKEHIEEAVMWLGKFVSRDPNQSQTTGQNPSLR